MQLVDGCNLEANLFNMFEYIKFDLDNKLVIRRAKWANVRMNTHRCQQPVKIGFELGSKIETSPAIKYSMVTTYKILTD